MRKSWLLVLATGALTGCANYHIQKGGNGEGYDVFRPEPYILVNYPPGSGPLISGNGQQKAAPNNAQVQANGGAPAPGGSTEASTASAQIIWLPNYGERYRLNSSNFLGKADFVFDLKDGWQLTQISDKSDNTAAVSGLLDIAKSLAGVASPAAGPKGGGQANQIIAGDRRTFDLYRIEFDPSGRATGLARMGMRD